MKIKVCGLRYQENISLLAELDIDFMGFIFYPESKRFVGNIPEWMMNSIPEKIKKIGVFVNEDVNNIFETVKKYGLWAVQLHGGENVEKCKEIHSKGIKIIKAFSISNNFDFNSLNEYENVCDFFLFDTKCESYGGSGKKFDWTLLSKYSLQKPYFLSGGIDATDAKKIIKLDKKKHLNIDINSKFEIEPGLKNVNKVKDFIEIIKKP